MEDFNNSIFDKASTLRNSHVRCSISTGRTPATVAKVVKNSNDRTIQPLTINLNFKLKQTTVPKLDTLFH